MNRLTSSFWVNAYFTCLRQHEIPAFVVASGDRDAGAVCVKLNTLDGNATAYQRFVGAVSGKREWMVLSEGNESEVDAVLNRQRRNDPDLWILEVEDREGRHLLNQAGLDD